MSVHATASFPATPEASSSKLRAVRASASPAGTLPPEAAAIVSTLSNSRRRVRQGEALYRAGADCQTLFVIAAGMFKTIVLDADGREQVTGFHMTGDVLGLDGMATDICQSSAVALEDSEVWAISLNRIEALCRQNPTVQRMFHRLLSREIQRDYLMMLLLGSMSAEERLAAFLVNLSQRLTARGYSATRFILRMSRREIGSYLGLTLETVSRVFSRFQREGLVRAELKAVELKDTAKLRGMVGASALQAA